MVTISFRITNSRIKSEVRLASSDLDKPQECYATAERLLNTGNDA